MGNQCTRDSGGVQPNITIEKRPPPLPSDPPQPNVVPTLFELCTNYLSDRLAQPEPIAISAALASKRTGNGTGSGAAGSGRSAFFGSGGGVSASVSGPIALNLPVPTLRRQPSNPTARLRSRLRFAQFDAAATKSQSGAGAAAGSGRFTSAAQRFREVELPESLIERIFERMVSQRLLRIENLSIFEKCHLSRLVLSESYAAGEQPPAAIAASGVPPVYAQVTDEWLDTLFAPYIGGASPFVAPARGNVAAVPTLSALSTPPAGTVKSAPTSVTGTKPLLLPPLAATGSNPVSTTLLSPPASLSLGKSLFTPAVRTTPPSPTIVAAVPGLLPPVNTALSVLTAGHTPLSSPSPALVSSSASSIPSSSGSSPPSAASASPKHALASAHHVHSTSSPLIKSSPLPPLSNNARSNPLSPLATASASPASAPAFASGGVATTTATAVGFGSVLFPQTPTPSAAPPSHVFGLGGTPSPGTAIALSAAGSPVVSAPISLLDIKSVAAAGAAAVPPLNRTGSGGGGSGRRNSNPRVVVHSLVVDAKESRHRTVARVPRRVKHPPLPQSADDKDSGGVGGTGGDTGRNIDSDDEHDFGDGDFSESGDDHMYGSPADGSTFCPIHLTEAVVPCRLSYSLQHISLAKCSEITDHALLPLATCTLLRHIDLSGCSQLSDALLLHVLPQTLDLTYLDVSWCKRVTNRTLMVALRNRTNITHLALDGCSIDDRGLSALSGFKSLLHFSVGWCLVPAATGGAIAASAGVSGVSAPPRRITGSGLRNWLPANRSLTHLNLAYTAIIHPAPIIEACTELQTLILEGTKFSVDAFRALPVGHFRNLTTLHLQRTYQSTDLPGCFLSESLTSLDTSHVTAIAPHRLCVQLGLLADVHEKARAAQIKRLQVLTGDDAATATATATAAAAAAMRLSTSPPLTYMPTPGVPIMARQSSAASPVLAPVGSPPFARSVSSPAAGAMVSPVGSGGSPYFDGSDRKHSQPLAPPLSLDMKTTPISSAVSSPIHGATSVPLTPGTAITGMWDLWLDDQKQYANGSGGRMSAAAIAASLPVIGLRTLRVEACSITNEVMAVIARHSTLTELVIADTDVANAGFEHLSALTNLRILNANGTKIHNNALRALHACHATLTELHVDGPHLSDGAMHAIAELTNLHVLTMFDVRLTDSAIETILPLAPNLHELELCGGGLTNAAFIALNRLQRLTRLNVSQNPGISDAGLSHLNALSQLSHLNLSGCKLTEQCLPLLQRLPALRSISLFGCRLKISSAKLKDMPRRVLLGIDEC